MDKFDIGYLLFGCGMVFGFAGMFTGSLVLSVTSLVLVAIPWIWFGFPPIGWIARRIGHK